MNGIPFIGEYGFYPRWARGSGRWLFQRTGVMIGQIHGELGRLEAMQLPVSDQIIVWCPPRRIPIFSALPSAIHRERQNALNELNRLKLVCYGEKCQAPKPGSTSDGLATSAVIQESGVRPDKWLLLCPSCRASVGPDLGFMTTHSPLSIVIQRWETLGRPGLDDPSAGAALDSAGNVVDLAEWAKRLKPNPFEFAYMAQQMWPDIETLSTAMAGGNKLSHSTTVATAKLDPRQPPAGLKGKLETSYERAQKRWR